MTNNICGYEVHALAGLVPMGNETQLLALQQDIKENGQRFPILLYRNKIVDGRCRATVCENLGIAVNFDDIGNNKSLKEVSVIVMPTNIRRNLTATQRAITAYRQWKLNPKLGRKDFYTPWDTSNKPFQAADELDVLNPDWLEALFNDKKIKIGVPQKNTFGNMIQKKSNSLTAVRDWAKKLQIETELAIVETGDFIGDETFEEKINALHPDQRTRYHSNILSLHADGTQLIKNKTVLIADEKFIKELAYREAMLSVKIKP